MRRLLILLLVLLTGLFWERPTAYAADSTIGIKPFQGVGVNPTIITIETLKPLPLGDHPTVEVRLVRYDGEPVGNEPIYVLVDDIHKNKVLTDSNGIAYVTLKYKFPARTYKIIATYAGSEKLNLTASRDETDLVVESSDISFRTVPPIAGVRLAFNNRIYVSNEEGIINFRVTESGMYTLEILPIQEDALVPNARLEFTRWNDNVFEPVRELYLPRTRPLEAGFALHYQVDQVFLDPNGKTVDPSRVSMMSMRGVGRLYRFNEAGPHWLPANRLLRRIGEHLESQAIPYYFQNVIIDGANVINQSQQRFFIHPDDVLPIEVSVYSVNFFSRDAMFNFPIGSGVQLEYPDGHSEHFTFESQATVNVDSLARGSYLATVTGVRGSAPVIPIYLSRDQDVELLVISYLDMVVIFGVPILVALTLLFFGRPYLLAYIFHPFETMRKFRAERTKSPGQV
jgi:hypothetical protein